MLIANSSSSLHPLSKFFLQAVMQSETNIFVPTSDSLLSSSRLSSSGAPTSRSSANTMYPTSHASMFPTSDSGSFWNSFEFLKIIYCQDHKGRNCHQIVNAFREEDNSDLQVAGTWMEENVFDTRYIPMAFVNYISLVTLFW